MDVEIEHCPGYLYVRMRGECVDELPAQGHPASLARACRNGSYRCLLLDVRELTGEIWSGVYLGLGAEIARAFAFDTVRIAMVGRVERTRELSLTESVVTRQGGILKAFTDNDEATKWLLT